MASRHSIPAEFTVGADVVAVRRGSFGTIPTIKTGKIVKVTTTQVTAEFEGTTGSHKARYVADYATRENGSMDEYGQKGSYSSYSTRLHIATSEHAIAARDEANRKRVVQDVKFAAKAFSEAAPTIEEAEQLIARLQRFINSSK